MKTTTIGKKIALGFGAVLALLVLAGLLSYFGVGGIVDDAGQVISGNKLDGELAQKEVDHLIWAGKVSSLLNDEHVTELDVQTDPHKCGFGQWLYGDGRRQAEAMVPSLAPLLKSIEEPHTRLHLSAVAIGEQFKPADEDLPGFLAQKYADHLNWSAGICRLFLENQAALEVQTDPHKCAFGQWYYSDEAQRAMAADPKMAAIFNALEEPHRKLHETATAIAGQYRQIHPGLLEELLARIADHRGWAVKVSEGIMAGRADLGVQTDPGKCALAKWLASEQGKGYMETSPELREAMTQLAEPHAVAHHSAMAISKALAAGNKAQAQAIFQNETLPALAEVGTLMQSAIDSERRLVRGREEAKLIYEQQTLPLLAQTGDLLTQLRTEAENSLTGRRRARAIYANETLPSLQQTRELLGRLRQQARQAIMTDQVMLDSAQNTRLEVSVVSAAAIVLGVLLSLFIVRGISAVLRRISLEMGEGAEQVAAAAHQVSSASQILAEGSSQQAASLEETSSSLEQMAAMTRRNADNAKEANTLMGEAMDVVAQAERSMGELRQAMETITAASNETAAIIRTIDDIAFQTNLLALNAAVEAARAGDAGAGFAVVAQEVRGLAGRAAEAAKRTQELIQGNLTHIGKGSELVVRTDEVFGRVEQNTRKIGGLLGEIAAACAEQAQGITQITGATGEMDKVTQQVAANAEESASSSEEMSGQAENLHRMVQELRAMVDGVAQAHQAPANSPRLLPPGPNAAEMDDDLRA